MKLFLSILFWQLHFLAFPQATDTIPELFPVKQMADTTIPVTTKIPFAKPEILSSGFIDIINNGQINASARFIRLYIGEPGKFAIPLSIYSGVSSNSFQNQQSQGGQNSNEHLINSFINPLSGLVNISLEGFVFIKRRQPGVTRTGFLYQTGLRIMTAYKTGLITDPGTGRPVNFINSFASSGLYFQTGAWERNNAKNVGVFWIAGRYIFCKSGKKQLQDIIPGMVTNGFYHGWSAGLGVEINNLVNIKLIYYQYVKSPEINYALPIYQFSFNYSLR